MTGNRSPGCDRRVEFFGRVSASFTHEMKNRLATMSESMGLLGDVLDLAEGGRPLDTAELQSCRHALALEIRRGFEIVRTFNRFAHSADHELAEVGLGAVVELVARLAEFQSFASQIRLDLDQDEGPKIETRPMVLEGLLYGAMLAAFRSVGPSGEIVVSVRTQTDGAVVAFHGIEEAWVGDLEKDDDGVVAEQLAARVSFDRDESCLSIRLPARIESAGGR